MARTLNGIEGVSPVVSLETGPLSHSIAMSFNEWLLERLQSDEEDDFTASFVHSAINDALADSADAEPLERPAQKKKKIHRNRAEVGPLLRINSEDAIA